MAYIDYGEWFNTISNKFETVEGVWCNCYDCRVICENAGGRAAAHGHIFHTKNEYRRHKNERYQAYLDWEEKKKIRNEELKSAHTKETEALEGHGRPSSVPTFFDVKTGGKAYAEDLTNPGAGWSRLWRASIREF